MKHVLSGCLILVIIALAIGCDTAPFVSTTGSILGSWTGTAIHGYPGPDDGPLADTVDIFMGFEDGMFSYSSGVATRACGSSSLGTLVSYEGDYVIEGDSISLTLRGDIPADPPLVDGTYSLELTETTLRLYLVEHPDLWPESWEIKLDRVIPE